MTKKQLTAKESAAIEYYVDPVSETRNNWCRSYLRAGYSHCKGWKTNALRILAKCYIKTAIEAKRQEIGKKISISREYLIDKLLSIVENSSNESNKIKAMALAGEFLGYKRELAPNVEKEARKAAKTAEEQRLAQEYAAHRTAEEAQDQKIGHEILKEAVEDNVIPFGRDTSYDEPR